MTSKLCKNLKILMLLDIGVGILLAIWMNWVFGVQLSFWFVVFGAVLVLLPDVDFFIELLKHGSVGGREVREHRNITHFPIIYIPVVAVIFAVWGPAGAIFFGLAVFAHFVHDSAGIGWGIKWLWPFSRKAYKCFSEKDGAFSRRLLVAWTPDELVEVAAKHGHPDWFRYIYLRPHPINVLESGFFLMSLVALYLYLH